MRFDGIYNSKFTQYLLIHYCPLLTYFGFSPHHFCLVQSTEQKNHISFAMIAISIWFIILFCILMHIDTFRKYLAITKQNKIDDIQHTNFPIAFPTFGCHPISQYSSLTGCNVNVVTLLHFLLPLSFSTFKLQQG